MPNSTGNYTGLSIETLNENLYQDYGRDYSSGGSEVTFAIVFGVLFSGVTGNLSIFSSFAHILHTNSVLFWLFLQELWLAQVI